MSNKYTLDKKDLKKIGKGAIIAASGAILTYLLEVIPSVDFGASTAVIVALISILINAGLKYTATSK